MERIQLSYLDPDLWVPKSDEKEIDTHFICVVCTGVVLDPTECSGCESLYCRGCLNRKDMACPKRCGGSSYQKVNRFIMNTLNKMEFKCQFSGKGCDRVVKYEEYSKHVQSCEHGQPEICPNPECQATVVRLKNEINQLKGQVNDLEEQKEKQMQVLKNQIQEMKEEMKFGKPSEL